MKHLYKKFLHASSVITMSTLLTVSMLDPAYAAKANSSTRASSVPTTFSLDPELSPELTSGSSVNSPNGGLKGPFISPKVDTSSDKPVGVIIQLAREPVAIGQYAAKKGNKSLAEQSTKQAIQNEQTTFLASAKSKGVSLDVSYRYYQVLNGMAVTVKGNQIPLLAKMTGVKAIYPNLSYKLPQEDRIQEQAEDLRIDMDPLKQIGVDKAWAEGFTGKGMKVGVIDSGIDYNHPDLKNAFKGGYDSLDQDNDPYEDIDYNTNLPITIHGTHVSGTIAGRAMNTGGSYLQKGVAYESDLYVYRVLSDNRGSTASVIDGIEHAVSDGMDVINLSLGIDVLHDSNAAESVVLNNAALAGVIPVVAAGNASNDAPYYYNIGSPASAELAITVGAATSPLNTFETVVGNNLNSLNYKLRLMGWNPNNMNFAQIFGNNPLEVVYLGKGQDQDYNNKNVEGKIVLVSKMFEKHAYPVQQQILAAAAHGAKAVIIFNGTSTNNTQDNIDLSESIPGKDGYMGYTDFQGLSSAFIPAFDMKGTEGRALAREMLAQPNIPLKVTFAQPFNPLTLPGDTMTTFSSRGPNYDGKFGIKPDLAGPGNFIRSTLPRQSLDDDYSKDYIRMSGTSMASPHIAGLATLLKEKYPTWTATDVRAALANTSEIMSNEDGILYDVYSQGAGRSNLQSALHTPALLKSLDEITILDKDMNPVKLPSEGSSVSFGIVDPATDHQLLSPLELKNVADHAVTYSAKVNLNKEFTNTPGLTTVPDWEGVSVKLTGLDSGGKLTVGPGQAHSFALALQVDSSAKIGVYEGTVVLEHEGDPALHLPFVFHIGKKSVEDEHVISDLKVSDLKVSPTSPVDITFKLNSENYNTIEAQIFDSATNLVGKLAITNGTEDGGDRSNLPKGEYAIESFNGIVMAPNEGEEDNSAEYGYFSNFNELRDGTYFLEIFAGFIYGEYASGQTSAGISITVDHKYKGNGELPAEEVSPSTGPTPSPEPGSGGPGPGAPGPSGPVGVLPTTAPSSSTPPVSTNDDLTNAVIKTSQKPIKVTSSESETGGTHTSTVTDSELSQALAGLSGPAAMIVTATSAQATQAELRFTSAQVESLKAAPKGSSIVFTWSESSVALPTAVLLSVKEEEGLVIRMKKNGDSMKDFAAAYPDAKIVNTPITFEAAVITPTSEKPLFINSNEEVTRSFLVSSDINKSTAGALYQEGSDVRPVPVLFSTSKNNQTIATITRPGFSTYVVAERNITFTDIGASWSKDYIEKLASKFIMNGVSSDKFGPKTNVTRAQFASILVRALGLSTIATPAPFSDVSSKDWFAKEVATAHAAGLVTGYEGSFKPNAEISRQELAVMLNRALKWLDVQTAGNGNIQYKDASSFGAYAVDDIKAVTAAGLMNGVANQGSYTFNPTEPTTREAAAKVLYQLLIALDRIS